MKDYQIKKGAVIKAFEKLLSNQRVVLSYLRGVISQEALHKKGVKLA